VNSSATILLAVGLFFLGGVYSAFKQGIKLLAVICAVVAALAITAGVLRI
jgi:hypothetical protein